MLGKLRRRIRLIVVIEGLVAVIIAVLTCFWIAFGLDYIPVLFGFDELSTTTRLLLLSIAVIVALMQLYRFIGRRFFVSLRNRSLALLVEKKHPEFEGALITTVSNSERVDRSEVSIDAEMVQLTKSKAESIIKNVDPKEIVGFRFLRYSATLACLLFASVIGLGFLNFQNFQLAVKRLYMLDSQSWPRRVHLEVVGVKVKISDPVPGIDELGQTLTPTNKVFKVPRGSSLLLTVRARDNDPLIPWRRLPSTCLMYFSSKDGESGTQALNRIGSPKDGWQTYSLNGPPFDSVLSDTQFTIRGDDFRDGPYRIEIVDQAIVTETKLDCVFPEYLSVNDSLAWTPRSIRWTGRASLPIGTSFNIRGIATKTLKKAYVFNVANSQMLQGLVDGSNFEFKVPPISETANLQFYFVDSDNLVSDSPHSVVVEPINDDAPDVVARLTGIGTAVTPNAILSFEGQIVDDYRVQETWVELTTADRKLPPAIQQTRDGGKLDSTIDLAELVRAGLSLTVDDGSELEVIIKAKDYFALNGESPNVGVGDRYSLELVSPNRLLRMLERIEVSQRRRLEQVFEEVINIRGYLSKARKQSVDRKQANDIEPGDKEANDGNFASRQQAMRIVFSQRGKLQTMKSGQDLRGITEAFENLRLQLINNRIDAEDRKQRLAEKIIAPLKSIPDGSLNTLAETINELESALKQIDKGIGGEQAESTASNLVDQGLTDTDAVLKEIDAVLSVLVKYESQNELLEIVRRMITEQEALMKRTKDKRQKDAFEGLLD